MKKPAGAADVIGVSEPAPSAPPRVSAPSRTTQGRILRGAVSRLVGRATGGILSLVALHYATRYFGPRAWGPIVAATALYTVFSSVGDFGTGRITSREVARTSEGASGVYGTSLMAASVLGAGGAVLLSVVGLALYSGRPETLRYVLVLVPAVVFMAWWQTSSSVLTARERNDVRALLDFGSSALLIGGVFLVITWHLTGTDYMVVTLSSVAITCFASLLLARLFLKARLVARRDEVVRFLRVSAPVGASIMLYALYLRIGVVLLSFFFGERTVGVYGVATQIAMFIMAAPGFLMGAVIAPFMRATREERLGLSQHALSLLVSVSLPVPVLLAIFGHAFVLVLAGPAFVAAVHPLVVLGVACVVWYLNAGLVDLVINVGGESRLLRPLLLSASLSVLASLVAVPLFGTLGAASVVIGTELLNLVQWLRLYRLLTGFVPDLRGAVPAVLATVTLAAVSELAVHGLGVRVSQGPVLALEVGGATLLYLAVLLLSRKRLRRAAVGEAPSRV